MEKVSRTLLKNFGNVLSRLDARVLIAAIGVIVSTLNWKSLIQATSFREMVGLVFLWLIALIVLSFIGELCCKFLGHGFVWLSEWYPAFIYFPKLELSCSITRNREIELRVINRKFWQKITLRAEYYCTYKAGSRPNIRGVIPPTVKELLPLTPMTGNDARLKVIGWLTDSGIILSTGNRNQEITFSQPDIYYYEVYLNGMYRKKEFGVHGIITIRIKENLEVECV